MKKKNMVGNEYEDGIDCQSADDGMTKEEPHKTGTTDINKMVARFEKTGMIEAMQGTPFFGDVSDVRDYQHALNVVAKGDELFMGYPAEIREKFDNNAGKFIQWLDDPRNIDEAIKLGIVVPRKEDKKEAPPVVPDVKP